MCAIRDAVRKTKALCELMHCKSLADCSSLMSFLVLWYCSSCEFYSQVDFASRQKSAVLSRYGISSRRQGLLPGTPDHLHVFHQGYFASE